MPRKPDTRRAAWMAAYEYTLVSVCPRLTGKVDWDTATYLYNLGRDARESAVIIARRYNEEHKAD